MGHVLSLVFRAFAPMLYFRYFRNLPFFFWGEENENDDDDYYYYCCYYYYFCYDCNHSGIGPEISCDERYFPDLPIVEFQMGK